MSDMPKEGYSDREKIAYNKGFRDGFIKGQEQGLEIAQRALEQSQHPAPIVINNAAAKQLFEKTDE